MAEQNYKIGVIGSEEAIMGFIPLGVTCLPIKEKEEIDEIINTLKSDQFAAVFITEEWATRVRSSLDEAFKNEALPALVTVPSPQGATKDGLANLKKIVEQAIGSDILFNN
jgi:V/A-type H+/Na+-transporting ATPase subunit F